MSDIKKNDYVVVQTTKESGGLNRPQLLKVQVIDRISGDVTGRLEKDPHLKEVQVTAKPTEILTNLGKSPKPGKVYGYDVGALYRRTEDDLHLFTEPDPAHLEKFLKGMSAGESIVKKKGFGRLVNACQFELEIVPRNGKYAGLYAHSRDPERNPHRIKVSIGEDTLTNASAASYKYVYLHELAHAIHFQLLHTQINLNSAWVALFLGSIGYRTVKPERSQEILEAILKNEGGLKGAVGDLDDDGAADLRLILRWLREFRNLAPRELDLLHSAKSKQAKALLKEVWPRVPVRSKKLKPLVTEYACKNWRELFAEACSFYLLDKELPTEVAELAEASLSKANQLAASI